MGMGGATTVVAATTTAGIGATTMAGIGATTMAGGIIAIGGDYYLKAKKGLQQLAASFRSISQSKAFAIRSLSLINRT
jgi:hypothetical protein